MGDLMRSIADSNFGGAPANSVLPSVKDNSIVSQINNASMQQTLESRKQQTEPPFSASGSILDGLHSHQSAKSTERAAQVVQ